MIAIHMLSGQRHFVICHTELVTSPSSALKFFVDAVPLEKEIKS